MKRTYLKRIYLIVAIVSLSLLTAGFINYKKPVYMNIFPTSIEGMGEIVPSELFDTWTTTNPDNVQSPTPQNVFVLPADGPNFVGDSGPTAANPQGVPNNLSFHRWASQMFLWILSPVPANGSYGTTSGLVLTSQEFFNYDEANQVYIRQNPNTAISGLETLKGGKNTINVGNQMTFSVKGTNNGSKNLPLLIEKETNQVFDVDKTPADDKGNPLIYDENRKRVAVSNIKITDNKPVFYDLNGAEIKKPSLIFSEGLDEKTTVQQFVFNNTFISLSSLDNIPVIIVPSIGQAGLASDKNVLMARNGSFVYYNIMVNDIYAVFSTMVFKGVANGGLPLTAKFPTTQAELDVIKTYAAAHNIPLVDTNNRVLAMELKTSWVETIQFTGVNYDNYVTIHTSVPRYVKNALSETWSIDLVRPTRPATLALVGMHVVGSVQGHPEMIWSTFEHVNNTPNVTFQYNDANSNSLPQLTDVNSTTNWLFCNPTATASSEFNVPYIHQSSTFPYPYSATLGHNISSSNTRRHKPFGWSGPTDNGAITGSVLLLRPEIPIERVSNSRLLALNYDVNTNLADGDVRKMYFQVGATWNSKTGRFLTAASDHVGTISLSNSTMETYTQGSATTAPDGLNCFSCHESNNNDGAIKDVPYFTRLSHVFGHTL